MKNNRKKKITAIRIGGLFILLVLVVIGCVYIDGSPNMNQGTEEEPRYWVNDIYFEWAYRMCRRP